MRLLVLTLILSVVAAVVCFPRCQLDWDEFMLRIPSYTPSTKRARSAKGSGSNASKQSATSERKSLAPAAAVVAPVDGNTAAMTDITAIAVSDAAVAPRSSSRRKLLASVGDSSEMSDRAGAEQSGNGGVAPSEPAATRTPAKRSSPSAGNHGPAAPANGDDKENAAVARGAGGSNRQQQPAADGDGFGSAHKRHRPSRTAAAVDAAPLTGSWARRGGTHDTPPSPPSEQAAQVAAAPGPIAMPPQDTTNKTGRVTRKHK